MKTLSKVDVITNSSSETFILVIPEHSNIETIKKQILDYHDKHFSRFVEYSSDDHDTYSGDCQDIEFTSQEESYKEYFEFINPRRKDEFTREMYDIITGIDSKISDRVFEITLDKEFRATINWLVKNFDLYDPSCIGWITDDNGKVLERD